MQKLFVSGYFNIIKNVREESCKNNKGGGNDIYFGSYFKFNTTKKKITNNTFSM